MSSRIAEVTYAQNSTIPTITISTVVNLSGVVDNDSVRPVGTFTIQGESTTSGSGSTATTSIANLVTVGSPATVASENNVTIPITAQVSDFINSSKTCVLTDVSSSTFSKTPGAMSTSTNVMDLIKYIVINSYLASDYQTVTIDNTSSVTAHKTANPQYYTDRLVSITTTGALFGDIKVEKTAVDFTGTTPALRTGTVINFNVRVIYTPTGLSPISFTITFSYTKTAYA